MNIISTLINCGFSGFESPAESYKKHGLSLDQLLISKPTSTFIGKASGNSMTGFGIFDSDLLIVDRSEPVTNGCIVIVVYNGEFLCKSIDTVNKLLVSASDEHKPIRITADDQIAFEGVVIRSIRMHKPSQLL